MIAPPAVGGKWRLGRGPEEDVETHLQISTVDVDRTVNLRTRETCEPVNL